jgi:hypothetical protein
MNPEKKLYSLIFTSNRIKMILQENDKIGKISSNVIFFICKFLELLIIDLLSEILFQVKKKKGNRVRKKDLDYHIKHKQCSKTFC